MSDDLTIELLDSNNNIIYTGNLLKDDEGRTTIEGLTWSSRYPKGYSTCSFRIRPKDIFMTTPIIENIQVLIFDAGTQVYDGVIETIPKQLNESDEFITISAVGPVAWLNRRLIRAFYIDDTPFERTTWPDGAESAQIYDIASISKRLKMFKFVLGLDNQQLQESDQYQELYIMPEGQGVRRFTCDFYFRTGEGLKFELYNVDDSITEYREDSVSAGSGQNGSIDRTFTTGNPRTLRLGFSPSVQDNFDQNDVILIENAVIYGAYQLGHTNYASPSYKQGELVEDLLRRAAPELSTDYTGNIGEPNQVLNPYVVDTHTSVLKIINEIAGYGDASLNTWGFSVWGREGTSDNKPLAVFEQLPATTDWEYVVRMNDSNLVSYSVTPETINLHNYIVVQYTDDKGITRYRTPTDYANLKDQTSIDTYGRRDFVVKIGQATSTLADAMGERYLTFHKDPTYTGNVVLRKWIRTKSGNKQPVNTVRGGERYFVPEMDRAFLIRQTSYSADNDTLSMSPGERIDGVDMWLEQRRRGLRA